MSRLFAVALAVVLVSGLAGDEGEKRPAKLKKHEKLEKQILDASNAYRSKNDRPALTVDATLKKIAQAHAAEMARRDKYGDDDMNGHILDGKGPADRARAAGYQFVSLRENVGYNQGHKDPGAVMMKGWIESKGHRENLLHEDISEIGIGAAQGESGRWYFVQLFGRPARAMKKITIEIHNKTKQKITLVVGKSRVELEPGWQGSYTFGTSAARLDYKIQWPAFSEDGKSEESTGTLLEGAKYILLRGEKKFELQVRKPK